MSFEDFIKNKFAPGWHKYGMWIAIGIVVLGLLAFAIWHTDKGAFPRDQMEQEMERSSGPRPDAGRP